MAGERDGRERLPDEVISSLGLDAGEATRIESGKVSRVLRAERAGDPVAVRQSPWFRTLEEVEFECRVLDALRSTGAPVAPPVVAPAVVDGHVWVAFEWAAGGHPGRPVEDPAWYGRLLARVHDASLRADVPTDQRPGWCRVDEFLTHVRAGGTTLRDVLPDFAAETGELGAWFRQLAEELHERLIRIDLDSLPRGVVQGDFGPHQVLVDVDADIATVIDWDFCHRDLFLADLAIGTSLARPTIDRAAAMLDAYLRAVDMDPGDPAWLGDLRSAFHLNNLGNQLCALWVHGFDVEPQLRVIRGRLEREQWWGPVLASALHEHRPLQASIPAVELSDLEVAEALADRAAVVASHYFRIGVTPDTKADQSPVTVADRAIERMLREALSELRPDDAVLGEELGHSGSGERTWILDPIDGTRQFVAGSTHWQVQIALQERETITVAVVDQPVAGNRWVATIGGGTWEEVTTEAGAHERRRLAVSRTGTLDRASCAVHPASLDEVVPDEVSVPPPTPLALVELIRGEIDAFYADCCQVWDHAPWILLVEEAGGAFTDHDGGHAPDRRGGLYSNREIHRVLLERLPTHRSRP